MFAEFEYCEQGAEVAPGPKRPEGCWQASAAAPCPPHRAVAGCRPSLSPLVVAPLAVFCTHVTVTNVPGWSSLPSLGLPRLLHLAAVGLCPVQGAPGLCFSSWWFTQHGARSQALSPRLGCTPQPMGPVPPWPPGQSCTPMRSEWLLSQQRDLHSDGTVCNGEDVRPVCALSRAAGGHNSCVAATGKCLTPAGERGRVYA